MDIHGQLSANTVMLFCNWITEIAYSTVFIRLRECEIYYQRRQTIFEKSNPEDFFTKC